MKQMTMLKMAQKRDHVMRYYINTFMNVPKKLIRNILDSLLNLFYFLENALINLNRMKSQKVNMVLRKLIVKYARLNKPQTYVTNLLQNSWKMPTSLDLI